MIDLNFMSAITNDEVMVMTPMYICVMWTPQNLYFRL